MSIEPDTPDTMKKKKKKKVRGEEAQDLSLVIGIQ